MIYIIRRNAVQLLQQGTLRFRHMKLPAKGLPSGYFDRIDMKILSAIDVSAGMSYVELWKKYHMDPRTAKRYAQSPQKPEYTLTQLKPTKPDAYKQQIDQWLEEAPYSAVRILEKLQEQGFDGKYSIVKHFLGPPGVGKTHLASALGLAAAKHRFSTYYINCHQLIEQLKKARFENRLPDRLKILSKYRMLIIDEIGYLPMDIQGANLFFQLIARRYEKTSTVFTSNKTFPRKEFMRQKQQIVNTLFEQGNT